MYLKRILFILFLFACEDNRITFLKNKNRPNIPHIDIVNSKDGSFNLKNKRRLLLNKKRTLFTLDMPFEKKMLDYFRSKVNLKFVLDKGEVFKFKNKEIISEENEIPFEEKKLQNFFQTVQISNDAGIFFDYVLDVKIALNHNIDFTEFKVNQIPTKFSIDHKTKKVSIQISYDKSIVQNLDKLFVTPVFKIEKNAKLFSGNLRVLSGITPIRISKQNINRKNIYKTRIKIVPHFGEQKALEYEMIIEVSMEMIFQKLEKVYENNLTILASALIAQVENLPKGYEILRISNVKDNNNGIAKIDNKSKSLKISKVGKFTFDMLLGPKGGGSPLLQKTIQCPVEIKKQKAPNISLDLLQKAYATNGIFTTQDIEGVLKPPALANGYVLKSIGRIQDSDLLSKQNKTLKMKNKAGSTKVTFVFTHPFKEDKTLTGDVKIQKLPPETFGFTRLPKKYSDNGRFSKNEILGNLTGGDKAGYTVIKDVENFSAADFKKLDPVTKEILFAKKLGKFNATVILQHPYKRDSRVNAAFEITKGDKEILTTSGPLIVKYELPAVTGRPLRIASAQIFAHLEGNKNGYIVSNITSITDANIAISFGNELSILKIGPFQANVFLTHPLKKDTDLLVSFEIKKGDAIPFTFTDLKIPFDPADSKIRKGTLENQIQPAAKKRGYNLVDIKNISDDNIARAITTTEITYTNRGTFTCKLHYENPNMEKSIIDARITIEKQNAPDFTFNKLNRTYGTMTNRISKVELESQLSLATAANGYTFKSVSLTDNDILEKTTDPNNPNAFRIKKVGTVLANITFEHAYKKDKPLFCEIQIHKANSPVNFAVVTKMEFPLVLSKKILKDDLLKKLNPNHKDKNYRIKEIKDFNPFQPALNNVTSDATKKNILYTNKGKFTCTIIFESDNYKDITKTGIEIDVKLEEKLFKLEANEKYEINYFTRLKNDRYLALGSVELSSGKYPYLLVFDSDLNVIKDKKYLGKKNNQFIKALELADGSLVVLSNEEDGGVTFVNLFKINSTNYNIDETLDLTFSLNDDNGADMNFSIDPGNPEGYVIASYTYDPGDPGAGVPAKNYLTLTSVKSDMTLLSRSDKADYEGLGNFTVRKMVTSTDGKISILVGNIKNAADKEVAFAVGLGKNDATGKYYKKIKFERRGPKGDYKDVLIQDGTNYFFCAGYEKNVINEQYAKLKKFSKTDPSYNYPAAASNKKETLFTQIKFMPDGKIAYTEEDGTGGSASSVPLIYGIYDGGTSSKSRSKLIKEDTTGGGRATDVKSPKFAFYEKTIPGKPKEEGIIFLSEPKQIGYKRGIWVIKVPNK